eukprot:6815403-Pyramimonas_sp.AAC.1
MGGGPGAHQVATGARPISCISRRFRRHLALACQQLKGVVMTRINPLHKAEASERSVAIVHANNEKAKDKVLATNAEADARVQAPKTSGAAAP